MISDADMTSYLIPTRPVVPTTSKRVKIRGEFLKGPIPLSWLTVASKTGDLAALQVALAVWWAMGWKRSLQITLTTSVLDRFMDTKDRRKKARGIKALENAGLISVDRTPRKSPIITILEVSE